VRGTALLLLAACAATAQARDSDQDFKVARRKVRSGDGASLALYRYAPEGGGGWRPAVLLVPDLGFGRESFDLQGEGLAPFLRRHGRDTYVVELRGQGNADAPAAWSLYEWAAVDLPAAVDAVQQAHPGGPVDLVVHGYGGALAIAAASRELQGKVRRVLAFSPAVAPEVPNEVVRKLLAAPGTLSRAVPERDFELLFTRDGNLSGWQRGMLEKNGPHDLGPSAAKDLLRWMESGDLSFPDGTTVRGRIAGYDRPTLVILPMLDNYAHAEFAEPLRALAPKAKVTLRSLSRLYLEAEDYTHLSMLHGRGAAQDVFLPALAFLDAADAPAPAPAPEVSP
jgi:pimeloyl-ACP methyl ester carboxylesterase